MSRKNQKRNPKVLIHTGAAGQKPGEVERRELPLSALTDILERTKTAPLADADRDCLNSAVETLAFLTSELERKGASIQRLKNMLFGTTESLRNIQKGLAAAGIPAPESSETPPPTEDKPETEKKKRPGHGRNGEKDFVGAGRVEVPHEEIKTGGCCPKCQKGKTYRVKEPSTLLRIQGMAPLAATVYELERQRCNGCGEVFTAKPPEGVGYQKYDESATAMVGLLRYGAGLPFNRIEGLEKNFGIPLPSATQWKLVEESEEALKPAWEALLDEAANGDVLHNDDTGMRVLDRSKLEAPPGPKAETRTGIFTSGIVSVGSGRQIAVFVTGRRHAGENLQAVLARRSEGLAVPIQMCDALSRNTKGSFQTLVGNCLTHGRRNFVEVVKNFPEECLFVLGHLATVYHHDDEAREQKMTPEQRLAHHQAKSAPLMEKIQAYMEEELASKRVEPNSTLGGAFNYMHKHWKELTLFLRVAGAPLDNTLCERVLKKAILHRKASMFYKTANGARVGDLYMTLIHTCELNQVNPFDYLVTLLKNPRAVKDEPSSWLPWNYHETLTRLTAPS